MELREETKLWLRGLEVDLGFGCHDSRAITNVTIEAIHDRMAALTLICKDLAEELSDPWSWHDGDLSARGERLIKRYEELVPPPVGVRRGDGGPF